MKVLVTGAAGFIGSSMVDRLLSLGNIVIGVDNLSTGRLEFLEQALTNKSFTFYKYDLSQTEFFPVFSDVEMVMHFSANADVRFGLNNSRLDLEQNTIVTYNILEAMRQNSVSKIVFASTGSVYGEASQIPTPENSSFPTQTSLYGASKVAAEALISAFCEGYGMQAWIFRFVSILGERYTHGHVYDFYKCLKNTPNTLTVLGDGTQRKSYLYIQDCLDAIFIALKNAGDKVNTFNLGVDGYCQVNDSIGWITEELSLDPQLIYSGGRNGWVGDNPFIYLDTNKIRSLGWTPKLTIKEAVIKTVNFLKQNEWVFVERH